MAVSTTTAPLASSKGGLLTFTLAQPLLLLGIGLLNEAGGSLLTVTMANGTVQTFGTEVLAPNNYQYVRVGLKPVVQASLELQGATGVALVEVGTLEPVNKCSIN